MYQEILAAGGLVKVMLQEVLSSQSEGVDHQGVEGSV